MNGCDRTSRERIARWATPPGWLGATETYESVTTQIGSIVLDRSIRRAQLDDRVRRRLPDGDDAFRGGNVAAFRGVGIWGINIPVAWGFAIVNFVWWIGIGHAGTLISAIPVAAASEVAHLDQPFRRSDDALRGGLRRAVPAAAPGAAMGFLLAPALPGHDGPLAAISQSAGMGRICGQHLFHSVAHVLVRRA